MSPNVGDRDQAVRLVLGSMLLATGIVRRRWLAAAGGLGLIYSAVSRKCPVNHFFGINTIRTEEPTLAGTGKPLVQETSEESFPASDPPAWTTLA